MPVRRPAPAIAACLLLLTLVAASYGCTGLIVSAGNYLTYDYPFTDEAAAKAKAEAEKLCAQRKQLAVQTSMACTMERCTTNFQCVDRKHPDEYEPGPFPPNQY